MSRNRKKNKNKKNKNPNPYMTSTVEKTMENISAINKSLVHVPTTPVKPITPVDPATKYLYTWTRCSHIRDEVNIANGKIYASGSRAMGDKLKETESPYIAKQVSIFLDGLSWGPITKILVDITNTNLSPLVKGINYINWPDFSTISNDRYVTLLHDTINLLNAGYEIEVGCIGAHGRTGTFIAGLIALTEGLDAVSSIKATRDRLCTHAIETKSQENMIYALCGEPLLPVPTYTAKNIYYNKYNQDYDDMFDSGSWYVPNNSKFLYEDIEELWDFENGETINILYFGKDIALEDLEEKDFLYDVKKNTFVVMTDTGEYISLDQFNRYMDVVGEVPWWIEEVNETLNINPLKKDTSPLMTFTPETKVITKDGPIKLNWIITTDFIWDEELETEVLFTEDDRIITREMYKHIIKLPSNKNEFLEYRVSDEEFDSDNILNTVIDLDTHIKTKYGSMQLRAILPSDFIWNAKKQRYEIYTIDGRIITGKEYLIIVGNSAKNQFLGS